VVAVASRREDRTYDGALAKPIMLRPAPTFWGAVVPQRIAAYQKQLSRHKRESAATLQRQRSTKLAMLFDHFRIADKKNMAALALALAVAHVPGFQVHAPGAKRGRKRKWDADRLKALRLTVQLIRRQHRFTDRQALSFMVNNQQHAEIWGVPKEHTGSKQQWIETLETRLQEAKSLQKLVRRLKSSAERELKAIAASMKFRK
jgi:hypothetical protein